MDLQPFYHRLWENNITLNTEDAIILGDIIRPWAIKFPDLAHHDFNMAEVLPEPTDAGDMAPWGTSSHPCRMGIVTSHPGAPQCFVQLYFTQAVIRNNEQDDYHNVQALTDAWYDVLGWMYDLYRYKRFPFTEWLDKKRELSRSKPVIMIAPRDESSLARLLVWQKLPELVKQASSTLARGSDTSTLLLESYEYSLDTLFLSKMIDKLWVDKREELGFEGLDVTRLRHVAWNAVGLDTLGLYSADDPVVLHLNQAYRDEMVPAVLDQAATTILEIHLGPYDGDVDNLDDAVEDWVATNPEEIYGYDAQQLHDMLWDALSELLPQW